MVQKALFPKNITREEINSLVDKAADIIRTATDYKFILVLLFLKRISDTWQEEFEEKKQEFMKYLDEKSAEKEAENEVYHTFYLRRDLLWDSITGDIKKLPENLSNALIKIAELNPELKGVIDKFSFLGFTSQEHREKLRQLVELFNQYNFSNKYVSSDIIGDAYEHILYKFAPTQAKEGEVYTPREVIELLVNILDPKPRESVYDPSCGSGGMLIISHKYVREKYGKEERLLLYGQEYNSDIYGLCKLNLVAHGITDAFVEFGDSLLHPRHTEGGRLKQFDVVIANVPWNEKGYGEEILKKEADFKERFSFGYSPNNTADWAWVQHMLASAKENGRIGLVIDNGCLFRGGAERSIRSKIVEKDWIECVILLPEKLFYNTGAPGAIIIFNKNKSPERKNKILFINASNEYIPHPSLKRLNALSKENINKIVEAYRKFTNIEGFSKVVDKEEIAGNDYNLNVTLYVVPVEEKDSVDIFKEFFELKELEKERQETAKKIEEYINELSKVLK
ncbi:MAG: N-6 DNA methylase [Thermoproteota archaeon]